MAPRKSTKKAKKTKKASTKVDVMFVVAGQEQCIPFSELDLGKDAQGASDTDLKEAVREHLGLGKAAMKNVTISRPATGNILISPRAVAG